MHHGLGALDGLIDLLVEVLVRDIEEGAIGATNEKRPRDPTKDFRTGVRTSTCNTIAELHAQGN